MAEPQTSESVTVSIVVPVKSLVKIRKIAAARALRGDRSVSVSAVFRRLIEDAMPSIDAELSSHD